MRKLMALATAFFFVVSLTACQEKSNQSKDIVQIELSDNAILVNGKTAQTNNTESVYTSNDIVYYEDGKDFTYGEGTAEDAHTAEEAAAHTVVNITKAGKYSLSGKLSKGQIAIDLGKEAKEDKNAVVTIILNGVDITCNVAPAVIFYNVYECGNTDTKTASKDVDTASAGANVIIADSTINNINGSYVARIYKEDSVVLNDEQTEVEEAKKLHKYDGAFYSKMSMNISGGSKNTGVLNIDAENEGLDTELHLTINGGIINIKSGNDGINTNEDEVSVTTINGGEVNIQVTGETGEGDGIDSNGWLVINGGKVTAQAYSKSADSGIDSDMGIHINGGTVIATGSMLDRIENGGQNYAVFNLAMRQNEKEIISLKNNNNKTVFEFVPQNAYSILIYSSPELKAGDYTLWSGEKQLAYSGTGFGGGMRPGGMTPPERPDGEGNKDNFGRPEGNERPNWLQKPENIPNFEDQKPTDEQEGKLPWGNEPPEDFKPDWNQDGEMPQMPNFNNTQSTEKSEIFKIQKGANTFSGISYLN